MRRFNVRVYFLLFNEQRDAVLVSDEIIAGKMFTKFPGGGLEWGEGPEDCVRREAMEELGQGVIIIRHFYTTGFFVQSVFRPDDQVISIYYEVKLQEAARFRISERPFDFTQFIDDEESFRWIPLSALTTDQLHFPIDQEVVRRIHAG